MSLPSWDELAAADNAPHEAALWGSNDSQINRFYRAVHHVERGEGNGPDSLLDYGCGVGELTEVVGGVCWYTGIDASPSMVERARLRNGDERSRFIVASHPPTQLTWAGRPHGRPVWSAPMAAAHPNELPARYEAVVALGTFNLTRDWTKQQVANAIEDLWLLTGRVLVVSVLRTPAPDSNYWNVQELVEIVEGLRDEPSSFTIDCWKANDAMLVCRR